MGKPFFGVYFFPLEISPDVFRVLRRQIAAKVIIPAMSVFTRWNGATDPTGLLASYLCRATEAVSSGRLECSYVVTIHK